LYQDHRIEKATNTFEQIKINVCKLHVKKKGVIFRSSTGGSNTNENVLPCIMTEIKALQSRIKHV